MQVKKQILLSRDQFREGTFTRDKHLCVICKKPAQDAHHIIERRLWDDGGYYLDNGASLCGPCHIKAEQTTLSVEEIRENNYKKILLPKLQSVAEQLKIKVCKKVFNDWQKKKLHDFVRNL